MWMHPATSVRCLRTVRLALVPLALLLLAPAARAAPEAGWPRQLSAGSEPITLYEPQPESLKANLLSQRAAFSIKSDEGEPTFGALWMTSRVHIDRDEHTVRADRFQVTRVRLPGADDARDLAVLTALNTALAGWPPDTSSYDELLTGLESEEKARASVEELKHEPPAIVFAQEPTVLLVFDGPPVLRAVEGTKLERGANSPLLVVRDPQSGRFYLSGGKSWYAAGAALGPWAPVASVPAPVAALLPAAEVKKGLDEEAEGIEGPTSAPRILAVTRPTELVVTSGPPEWAPLVGAELLFLKNTESDVLRELSTQTEWVLLAGRWFRAPTEAGPWTFVRPDQLPASFARIPPESARGNLLAFVAGTDEAQDAVMDTQIPQTAAINRTAKAPAITYDGPPQFEPAGPQVKYAKNSAQSVIEVGGKYYLCENGVWWVSDSPGGGFVVADTVPDAVQTIPPSSPAYNLRYVQVYDSSPEVVYVGYTPGYLWSYPYYGTVVYGTGFDYAPWSGPRFYYPRPLWWGFHAHYNPWWGWGFGGSYNYGFYRAGYYGGWGHGGGRGYGGGWYGPGGWRRPQVVNHYTTVINNRGPRAVARGGSSNLYSRPGARSYVSRTRNNPAGRPAQVGRGARGPNDAMPDRGGNVYRRGAGGWQPHGAQPGAVTPGSRPPGAQQPPTPRPQSRQPGQERGTPQWHEDARSRGAAREQTGRSGGFGGRQAAPQRGGGAQRAQPQRGGGGGQRAQPPRGGGGRPKR